MNAPNIHIDGVGIGGDGWRCPGCGACYNPAVLKCFTCAPLESLPSLPPYLPPPEYPQPTLPEYPGVPWPWRSPFWFTWSTAVGANAGVVS